MYRELEGFPPSPDANAPKTPSTGSVTLSRISSSSSLTQHKAKQISPKPQTELKLPPIHGAPKANAFPVTTAHLIGWKSTRPENNLEIYPTSKAKGQIGILKIFNWPQQSL